MRLLQPHELRYIENNVQGKIKKKSRFWFDALFEGEKSKYREPEEFYCGIQRPKNRLFDDYLIDPDKTSGMNPGAEIDHIWIYDLKSE